MEKTQVNVHSQEYMETMARLMSEALESPEGMRALAAAIAAPIEQEIKRKEISSLLLTRQGRTAVVPEKAEGQGLLDQQRGRGPGAGTRQGRGGIPYPSHPLRADG